MVAATVLHSSHHMEGAWCADILNIITPQQCCCVDLGRPSLQRAPRVSLTGSKVHIYEPRARAACSCSNRAGKAASPPGMHGATTVDACGPTLPSTITPSCHAMPCPPCTLTHHAMWHTLPSTITPCHAMPTMHNNTMPCHTPPNTLAPAWQAILLGPNSSNKHQAHAVLPVLRGCWLLQISAVPQPRHAHASHALGHARWAYRVWVTGIRVTGMWRPCGATTWEHHRPKAFISGKT